jgi:hypothetical protein
MRLAPLAALLLSASLPCGCAYQDASIAAKAQRSLVGTPVADLDLCAGLPTKTEKVRPGVEMRSYETSAATNSGVTISFPVIGGGVNLGNGGYCHATFEVVDGRVAALRYAGDTTEAGARGAVCAPIVRGCVDQGPGPGGGAATDTANRHGAPSGSR